MKETLKRVQAHGRRVNPVFPLLFIGIGVGAWFAYEHITNIYSRITQLENKLATTTEQLQQDLQDTRVTLSDEILRESQNIDAIERQLGIFEQEVGTISGTVSTLEKLSETDAELLQKYSRVFFLNEHYSPERLVELPDEREYFEEKHTKVHEDVWPYLRNLLERAERDGIPLFVFSGYRSFSEQGALKEQYTITYGEGTANQFSAEQGYSEHQLGTTVDFITTGIGGTLRGFDETEAYQWLLDNAHRYGFVLSYPEGNEHYIFEPWHWRFVGVELATDLHNSGQGFYDLEQREIDEYLVNLFD